MRKTTKVSGNALYATPTHSREYPHRLPGMSRSHGRSWSRTMKRYPRGFCCSSPPRTVPAPQDENSYLPRPPQTTHSCFGDYGLSSRWLSESPREAETPAEVSKGESSVPPGDEVTRISLPATSAGPEVSFVGCLAKYFARAISLLRSSARLTCLVTANCQPFDAIHLTECHTP